MPARLPDFLGLGTQKGGTTSLHRWLSNHPEVYLPTHKEIHYFDLQYTRKINWYREQFSEAKKNQICGEITPYYLYHPAVPKRIKEVTHKIKLIVLLRDPAERALSQYFHAKKRGFETLAIAEALRAEKYRLKYGGKESKQKHSYVSRSFYLEQLDRYEKLFEKECILVLKSEDLFESPYSTWKSITNFLEVDSTIFPGELPKENARGIELTTIEPDIRRRLREKLCETAMGVRKRYGFGWDWA